METLSKFKAGAELDWREVELCLYVLFTYGEALPKGAMQFVKPEETTTLTPLGEMVSESIVSSKSYGIFFFLCLTRMQTFRAMAIPRRRFSFLRTLHATGSSSSTVLTICRRLLKPSSTHAACITHSSRSDRVAGTCSIDLSKICGRRWCRTSRPSSMQWATC